MKGQKEVVRLLKEGGRLMRDFVIDVTDFRVVGGGCVKRFPLKLLRHMKEEGIVEVKGMVRLYSDYVLVKKKKVE